MAPITAEILMIDKGSKGSTGYRLLKARVYRKKRTRERENVKETIFLIPSQPDLANVQTRTTRTLA